MSLVGNELLRHAAVLEHGLVDNWALLRCELVELLSQRNSTLTDGTALQLLD